MKKTHLCPPDYHPCLAGVVAESLEDITYISDPETYDVLWLNPFGQQSLGIKDFHGLKCYKLLLGLDSPCSFCPLDRLSFEYFHIEERANVMLGKHFLVKDKLVSWRGRTLHLAIAVDITAQAEQRNRALHKFKLEQMLVKCVRILLQTTQLTLAIGNVLSLVGQQFKADRVYIFEFDGYFEDDSLTIRNTYEWCSSDVKPQQTVLQRVPFEIMRPWLDLFEAGQDVAIEDLQQTCEPYQKIFTALRRQNTQRLFAVPLQSDGRVRGFIGVDNPRSDLQELSVLRTLAHLVSIETSKRRISEELRTISMRDSLTGMGNRNAYLEACRILKKSSGSLGVAFIDLNNLKYINDNFGHEEGDKYICSLSELFLKHFRSRDIFRIGGDEFVFLCENMSESLFNAKLKALLREGEKRFPGSIAMGSIWSPHSTEVDSMVRESDLRMYAEKQRQKAKRGATNIR